MIKITPFLSSLGMVRFANGSSDTFNCLGECNPRQGVSASTWTEWRKMCNRVRLTAIFLHLRGTQVTGEQAAHVVGVNLSQFYQWRRYAECDRLWSDEGVALVMSVTPRFDLAPFLPKSPKKVTTKKNHRFA